MNNKYPNYLIKIDDIIAGYWSFHMLIIDIKTKLLTGQDYELYAKISTLPLNWKQTTLKELVERRENRSKK